jgi:hypothetical protein
MANFFSYFIITIVTLPCLWQAPSGQWSLSKGYYNQPSNSKFKIYNSKFPEGKYRWDIKLLTDTAGQRVFSMSPLETDIHQLVNISRPSSAERKNGRAESEKKKVSVDAYIVMFGKEDDKDYHLVLSSLDWKDSLIAEIPEPETEQLKEFTKLKNHYRIARTFIDSCIMNRSKRIHLITPIKVKITGVLFFDKIGHGKGHAMNGIEIHPILEIKEEN